MPPSQVTIKLTAQDQASSVIKRVSDNLSSLSVNDSIKEVLAFGNGAAFVGLAQQALQVT